MPECILDNVEKLYLLNTNDFKPLQLFIAHKQFKQSKTGSPKPNAYNTTLSKIVT